MTADKFDHSKFDATHLPERCIVCQDKILRQMIEEQKRDEALWAEPKIISEAYMQTALMKIHAVVGNYLALIEVLDEE